jgi:hypothetical protein
VRWCVPCFRPPATRHRQTSNARACATPRASICRPLLLPQLSYHNHTECTITHNPRLNTCTNHNVVLAFFLLRLFVCCLACDDSRRHFTVALGSTQPSTTVTDVVVVIHRHQHHNTTVTTTSVAMESMFASPSPPSLSLQLYLSVSRTIFPKTSLPSMILAIEDSVTL